VLIAVCLLHFGIQRQQRLRGGVAPRLLGLGFLMVLIAVGLLMGLGRGAFSQNPLLNQYQQGMLILFFVTLAVTFAVPSQRDGARVLTIIAYFLTALTFAEFMSIIFRFLGVNQVKGSTLDFQYVVPLAAIYWFIRYFTEKGHVLRNCLVLSVVVFGVIVRLQKPVVVPLLFAFFFIVSIFLIVYLLNPRLRSSIIIKRGLLLVMMFVVAIILLEIAIPASFLGDYRLIFYDRFLKINPVTGVSEGRIDGGRLEYYTLAWRIIQPNPVFGLGIGAAFPHPYRFRLSRERTDA
jgi:hypothetical protein